MTDKEKVVFYFPWKEISGGPYYLAKLADDLADTNEFDVYYTDYKNGLTSSLIKNSDVNKIDYTEDNFQFPFTQPVTIITPIYWAYKLPQNINKNSKIVFLNWHYCCIPVLKSESKWSKSRMGKFLRLIQKTNSCFFLDYSHLLGQNTKTIKFSENIVPITLREKSLKVLPEIINQDEVNMAILGRLDGDKVYSCLNLLDNLSNILKNKTNRNKKINVHIIGDGCHRSFFEDECRKSNYFNKGINIICHGIITGNNLNEFLCKNADVLFAMGTSVLEGASLALPSVIIPSNSQKFYDDKYVYIQDSIKYCLGWFNTQLPKLNVKTKTLEEVLDDIYEKNLKEKLGLEAFEYYKNNHRANIENFIQAISKSTLKYNNILKMHKKSFLRYIFNVKNDYDRKIITFFGVKFKVKSKLKKLKNELNASIASVSQNCKRDSEILLNSICYQANLYSKVSLLHNKVFPKYKNLHQGDTAVIIASGPTVNYYNPDIFSQKVYNVAVNGSFNREDINFDYLFLQDYSGLKESVAKIPYAENLKKAKKFYGIMSPVEDNFIVPEQYALRDNAERYYVHSVCYDAIFGPLIPRCNYALDLSCEFLMCHGTIPLIAMQFLLYANFSKIYLVGCDCSIKGHFSNKMEKQVTEASSLPIWLLGWEKMKKFAQVHYPDTEIISINPVGLKGLFQDIYTDEYLENSDETKICQET